MKCHFCKRDHRLSDCFEFSKISLDERRYFIRSQGLCYKCLGGKHAARECRSREKCKVSGCTSTLHHTLLHLHPRPNEEKVISSETSSCSTTNDSKNASELNTSVFLNVVPVRVRYKNEEEEVYAFLDQG